ncbi:MAG: type I secretion system permease/ATPase [Rhodospirillaceae bacterium]|nr:type I secretion system permease/ATPase [Rhodospirillaceae bacterium]
MTPQTTSADAKPDAASPLIRARGKMSGGIRAAVIFSCVINLLMLAAPIYSLQVFDRVLTSQSVDTLLFLTLIIIVALAALGGLEIARGRILSELGCWLERTLSPVLLERLIGASAAKGEALPVQGLRDLEQVRGFLSGPALKALLDAPWTPIFVIVMFMLHPLLGVLTIFGGAVLLALAYLNDKRTQSRLNSGNAKTRQAMTLAEAACVNADAVAAMGMTPNVSNRWRQFNADGLADLQAAGNAGGNVASLSKFMRMSLQICSLGLGAWLVLQGQLSAGGMLAGSILLGRAMAPIDQAIGSWRSAVGARAAYTRLGEILSAPIDEPPMPLSEPEGRLEVNGLSYAHPGAKDAVLRNLDFTLEPGDSLAIVGPTATGKTTLARLLVGSLTPLAGEVRIDGANIKQWDRNALGKHIGYLPQDVELFAGTVKENIARLGEVDADLVVEAAQRAGAHDLILALDDGYETDIGQGGAALSGGQRQRIALARALYGNPKIVVLDEPNANLDNAGDQALIKAMQAMAAAKITAIIIAHRPSVLKHIDYSLVLQPDAVPAFGPREEIFKTISAPAPVAQVVGRAS